jgi:circadian clock protein KaiB
VSGGGHESERAAVALCLYVADDTPPSVQARRQVETLRVRLGGEDWEIKVVDVFERPDLAEADRVLATPVLVRLHSSPRLSVIGDLGDWRTVATILDLEAVVDE